MLMSMGICWQGLCTASCQQNEQLSGVTSHIRSTEAHLLHHLLELVVGICRLLHHMRLLLQIARSYSSKSQVKLLPAVCSSSSWERLVEVQLQDTMNRGFLLRTAAEAQQRHMKERNNFVTYK